MGDYKSFLFVWCAKNKRPAPEVKFVDGVGSSQQKRFICEVTMSDFKYVAVGTSTNKKDAQLNAARDYVQYLMRSNVISDTEVRTNLRNEGSEILGSNTKDRSLGLNKPSFSVFKAGVGPQSLGVAYQPAHNRSHDYSAIAKHTVDEQETTDVNAAIHGNWTVNEAKNRLNQFMQMNKIKGEYRYSFIGPDNAKTFIAELSIFVPQLNRNLTGRESGSSKMAASKSCALSLVRQLYHLGVVERCCTANGTAPRLEQMPPYPVQISPQLKDEIINCMAIFGVEWDKYLKKGSDEDGFTLLPGRQAEQTEDDTMKGRVVTWSPPQANWDPWRGANIDDTNPPLAMATLDEISKELHNEFTVHNPERDRILKERRQLPIFSCRKNILQLVDTHPVIIVKGATGCGKTTQMCQYILDSWILDGKGAECNIVVTQPRRISAISVAERVSRERCEELGTSVGYSVRFETVLPRPYGSLLFCTVGVLLRKLEIGLRGISHVIVDEIHERDVNTDFLLVVLRDTLHVYPDLRVILMSATVDTEMFSNYFNNCPVIEVPGRCFDICTYFLEDTIEILNFKAPPQIKKKSKSEPIDESDEEELSDNYQQSTKDSLALLDDKEIPFELIYAILVWCKRRGEGAVLIFLPGWSTIFSLMKRLLSSPEFRKREYIILPLHSQLPRDEQRHVFEQPPHGVMKIILATNIAESSITINDVVYVIDCCKVKVKMFTSHNNMIHYATVWASRSNMEQRTGRAGRTANGYCFRLCTRARYAKLEEHIVAEMLRTSLEELALNIKLLGLGSVSHFLSKALEPPPIDAVIEAQVLLKEMHCLGENYDLTPLGRMIAKLPLEPRLARMVIIGCVMELGDAATTIASNVSLSSEVFDIEIAMSGKQRWFAGSRCSDQLASLNAFKKFHALENRGLQAQQEYACQNELSLPALVFTKEAKLQIKEILADCGFPAESMLDQGYNFSGEDIKLDILSGLLTIGSYPNVCFHKERRKVLTTESKPALIIKTSVNCTKFQTNFPSPFFVYNEKLRTKTVYCKTLGMVTPLHILLFGCNQAEVSNNIVKLDGWIYFEMEPETAALILGLRPLLESVVTKVAAAPDYIYRMTQNDEMIVGLIKSLCEFNCGRYNLPQYAMSKEAQMKNQKVQMIPAGALYAMERMSFQSNNNNPSDTKLKRENSKENDTEVYERQSSDGVKLDPNTSRMVLAKHQKRPNEPKSSVETYQPQMESKRVQEEECEEVESVDEGQFIEDTGSVNSATTNGRGRTFMPPDPYPYYNQQYYDDSYTYDYNNPPMPPPPPPRPMMMHRQQQVGNPRLQNMYGSANYYRQRYAQQPVYPVMPEADEYYQPYRGRRHGSRGRGMYPNY